MTNKKELTARQEELEFLIRTKTPIQLNDIVVGPDGPYFIEIPGTNIMLDFSDLYTVRDLCEYGLVKIVFPESVTNLLTVDAHFSEDVRLCDEHGTCLEVFADESISVKMDHETMADILDYLKTEKN